MLRVMFMVSDRLRDRGRVVRVRVVSAQLQRIRVREGYDSVRVGLGNYHERMGCGYKC